MTLVDPADTAALALEHPAEPVEPPTPATTASDAAAVLAKRKAEVVAADKVAVTMADLDAVERGLREELDTRAPRPVSAQPLTTARKPEAAPALGVGALVGIGLMLFLFWWLSRKRKA